MAGLSAGAWFDLAYLLIALTFLALLVRHARRPLAIVPASPMGRGQLLYVVLLWWLVVGNFERALVALHGPAAGDRGRHRRRGAARARCSCWRGRRRTAARAAAPAGLDRPWLARTIAAGLLAAAGAIVVDWAVVRAVYGDRFAGARQPAHPVRPERDDPSRREAMSVRPWRGRRFG